MLCGVEIDSCCAMCQYDANMFGPGVVTCPNHGKWVLAPNDIAIVRAFGHPKPVLMHLGRLPLFLPCPSDGQNHAKLGSLRDFVLLNSDDHD